MNQTEICTSINNSGEFIEAIVYIFNVIRMIFKQNSYLHNIC